ncbi:MOSC domain-containing protein [Streptomyces sp. ME19-01-6]|uniref:MOSC domain-containing protein n=1 Tax=Streptomyces sp. ME19-01-6 TaxID=3028686 RepID=UPI0029A42314|nr:MOSC N-terminal beta barrel domain-containing protein [Streptomyces sp. ME19-01-6]MDX3228158.1 MOSC domain-containing protein [Streptomyces sp. ME19-01-6]
MVDPALSAIHVYAIKSVGGTAPLEAVVEPWGLAGDRRWMVVEPGGQYVTQRQQARLALVSAEPLPGGGIRLGAAGHEPLTVAVPEPGDGAAAVSTVWLHKEAVEVVSAGAAADEWFSGFLGSPVRLVHLDDPARRRPLTPEFARAGETVSLADEFPLLLTTTASLDALNSLIAQGDHPDEGPLPMNRFRPNVVVEGTAPWAEDGWRRIRIGEVVFRVTNPCARCVITTTDQETAERGKEPLRTLARHRRSADQLLFGQNLVPELPELPELPRTAGPLGDGRGAGTLRVGDRVEILE